MKLCIFTISLAFNCAFSQNTHKFQYVVGCFYSDSTEVLYTFEENLAMYSDFQNNTMVLTFPPYVHFDLSPFPNIFNNAVKAKKACLAAQLIAEEIFKDIDVPEVQEPPESILYPADEVQTGFENTLICFVNRFYPPRVKVTWTKNNGPVSEGVSISSYMPNNDQSFHYFSSLKFKPKDGDVYSCTVEHMALETPKTKIWEVDLKSQQYLAIDLFCGVGLTVGFVGVAVGTFLIVKGCYGHQIITAL